MTRRTFLATAAGSWAQARRDRPNIVVILADDMGYSDLGCYGSEIQTPNIDGLAKRGVRFTQFYNTARCCPTRASLLTGLYAHQAGIGHMVADWGHPGYRGTLSANAATIAEVLKPAGYGCYMSGKWHVTHAKAPQNLPKQRGFDEFFGTLAGGGSYYYPNDLMRGNDPVKPPADGFYYTDAITDSAIEFVNKHRNNRPRDPMFLYVAYTAPHWPLHALEADIAKYRSIYREGWDALREARHKRQLAEGIVHSDGQLAPRDPAVPAWTDTPNKEWEIERMSVYAAQIDRLDQAVGRLVAAVPNNTLVMFLSDNGASAEIIDKTSKAGRHTPWDVKVGNDPSVRPGPRETFESCGPSWAQLSNTPFRSYKKDVHEGGIATPFIAMWKGDQWKQRIRNQGSLAHTPCHVIDILPTCLEVAAAPYPKKKLPLPGRSVLPGIEGRPLPPHEAIFWEHEGNQAMREGRLKLVRSKGSSWELYDLESDRTESNDLAAVRTTTVSRMAAEYGKWMRRSLVLPWDEAHPASGGD